MHAQALAADWRGARGRSPTGILAFVTPTSRRLDCPVCGQDVVEPLSRFGDKDPRCPRCAHRLRLEAVGLEVVGPPSVRDYGLVPGGLGEHDFGLPGYLLTGLAVALASLGSVLKFPERLIFLALAAAPAFLAARRGMGRPVGLVEGRRRAPVEGPRPTLFQGTPKVLVEGDQLVLRHSFLGVGVDTRWNTDAIVQFFVREEGTRGGAALWVRFADGLEERLLASNDLWSLRKTEVELERQLGIPDRLVADEVAWRRRVVAEAASEGAIELAAIGREPAAPCPVCGDPITARRIECPACEVPSHQECWEYAGCSTFGCAGARPPR